ncbi:MAG: Rne/Rng family ribonuclease [Planctomycetes bacterium]|nr:Rne/Rng family ribonuclease [Planctomycetota bacterium]
MTQAHDSGAEKAPSFGAFLEQAPEGSTSPDNSTDSSGGAAATRPRRRRGSRGGRRRSGRTKAEGDENAEAEESPDEDVELSEEAVEAAAEAVSDDDADEDKPARKKRSRRGRRGKRGATTEKSAEKSAAEGARSASAEGAEEDDAEDGDETAGEIAPGRKKRGRRGGRGGRKRRRRDEDDEADERGSAAVAEWIPGEEDDLPELPELPDDAELLDEGPGGSKKKRKRRRRKSKASDVDEDDFDDDDEEDEDEEGGTRAKKAKKKVAKPDRQILVNASDREEIRVAVVKDQRIIDFQMNVESDKSLVNDIYRGRVVNLEESIGAAFIDFGRGRNGFLHTSDVLPAYGEKGWDLTKLLSARIDAEDWDENSSQPHIADELDDEHEGDDGADEKPSGKDGGRGKQGRGKRRRSRPRQPIKDMLKVGDRVVVQVTKDAIGDKGPTLTTYISIPGRYHVLMPSTDHRGVSRKIEDARERRRLKKILDGLEIPEGMGVIARTAAKGCTKVELKRDLDYLLDAWNRLSKRVSSGNGPLALYQESDVAIRTVRDLFGPQTESVIVDEPKTYERVKEFAELLMPEYVDRIKLHEGDRPLFHSAGIEQEFERIFSRRIELPSGGSIVFDQAEALVAIDVNSGKTRTSSHDFEEIALKTNMEAVPEIARQIRLRDLGGILVVDFIDMMKNSNRRNVEKAFRNELAKDRARSKVGRISQFGLLEMTRQRLGPGMSKKLFQPCGTCRGLGRVRTPASRAASIHRRLGSAMTLKGFSTVEVRAHPDALQYLKKEYARELDELEKQHSRKLTFTDAPDQLEDSVLRYLRADGREVRPGGRRKR